MAGFCDLNDSIKQREELDDYIIKTQSSHIDFKRLYRSLLIFYFKERENRVIMMTDFKFSSESTWKKPSELLEDGIKNNRDLRIDNKAYYFNHFYKGSYIENNFSSSGDSFYTMIDYYQNAQKIIVRQVLDSSLIRKILLTYKVMDYGFRDRMKISFYKRFILPVIQDTSSLTWDANKNFLNILFKKNAYIVYEEYGGIKLLYDFCPYEKENGYFSAQTLDIYTVFKDGRKELNNVKKMTFGNRVAVYSIRDIINRTKNKIYLGHDYLGQLHKFFIKYIGGNRVF